MSNIAIFNIGEMDKSQELYSIEGDNSSWFEGKTVAWEHTIIYIWLNYFKTFFIHEDFIFA